MTFIQLKNSLTLRENRIIHFADKSGGGPESAKKKEVPLLDHEIAKLKSLNILDLDEDLDPKTKKSNRKKETRTTGELLIERYQNQTGEFSEKTFKKIHRIASDPNKMAEKPYQFLIKGIAEGRLYVEGKEGEELFKLLVEGIENEGKTPEDQAKKSYANELVQKVADGKVVSKRLAKAEVKKMRGIEKQADGKEAESARASIGAKALGIATSGATHEQVAKNTDTIESNWAIEQPPKELIDRRNEYEKQHLALYREKEQLNKLLSAEKSKSVPDLNVVRELNRKIAEITEKLDKLIEGSADIQKEWTDYLTKTLTRFRALKYLSKRAGFDLNKVSKLTTWFLNISKDSEKPDHLQGVEIDKTTGETSKSKNILKIDKIFFDAEKTDMTAQAPGELFVEYTYVEGEKPVTTVASYKNFLALMDAYEGHEDLDDPKVFNEKYAPELGYKDINQMEGDTFTAVILKDLNGDEKVYDTLEFKVDKVRMVGGKLMVKLNKVVTTLDKNRLINSIDRSHYFDRKENDFTLGQFGMFLRKNDFQREISEEEMQTVVDRSIKARNKECEGFTIGMTEQQKEVAEKVGVVPNDTFQISPEGITQYINYVDENNIQRKATLTRTRDANGKVGFDIAWNPSEKGGLPGAPQFPDEPLTAIAAVPGRRVTKKHITGPQLIQAINKGQIQNAPSQSNTWGQDPNDPSSDPYSDPMGTSDNNNSTGSSATGAGGEEGGGESGEESSKEEQAPEGGGGKKKRTFYEEALPYEDIFKAGGMQTTERGLLKSLWVSTRFLSIDDLWEMGKSMYEYYNRRFERRQKEKYSSLGQELPFWAPEMRRINQASENEQVNQFKESFEQKGISEIQLRLQKTSTRDEMKAALITLNEKGQMRWDDIDFWRNINKFVDPSFAIPIPSNGDPNTRVSETDERTGFDFLKDAIDSLWGEGQYNEWFRQNKSAYISNAKNYYEEGKQLEGVQGGHERRLATLLRQHKEGYFVDPHEYEGLILHSIEAGKSDMQSKIYYMIEGVAFPNKHGRTIMDFERIAHINSEMLIRFPILEYITARAVRSDGGIHRFTNDDYKQWAKWFDDGDPMNCRPSAAVDRFMWKYVIPSDDTQNRINKALRHGENLDHDDMFAYLPPATEQVITDTCKATTGSKKFLTIEGYANVIPGFSQYMRSLADDNNRDKLVEAVKSYVRFEGIMTDKFEKARTSAQDSYQRLDGSTLNSATIVSSTPPAAYISQMNAVVQRIITAYDDPTLNNLANIMYGTKVGDLSQKSEQDKQNTLNNAFHNFGDVFHKVVKRDNGQKMTAIIASANLEGLTYIPSAEKEQRKAEQAARKTGYTNKLAFDY